MKHIAWATLFMSAFLVAEPGYAQQRAKATATRVTLGRIRIPRSALLTNGDRLRPAIYDVRLTAEPERQATGSIPGTERRVEFVRRGFFFWRGKAVGNEIVNIVPAADIGQIADEGVVPAIGGQNSVVTPHNFLRLWFNRGDLHYLIYLRLPN